MKKNKKIMLILILLILVVIITIGIIIFAKKYKGNEEINTDGQNDTTNEFVETLLDGTKVNISSKLNQSRSVNGLQISNIQLKRKDSQTILLAEVENVTEETTDEMFWDIVLIDNEANILTTVPTIIVKLKPGEKTQLNIGTQLDYVNAYDFRIIEK